jgi:hypothetical protein
MKGNNHNLDNQDDNNDLANIINSQLSFLNDKFSVIESINENASAIKGVSLEQ